MALYAAKIAEQRPVEAPASDRLPGGLSVNELLLAYIGFAKGYYVKNGQQTGTLHEIGSAIRPLKAQYGQTPAADFGPLKLEALRNAYVGQGWTRPTVNRSVGSERRIFKWGVSRELIPSATYVALAALDGLRRGRNPAREPEGVKPVPDAFVDATKADVSPQIATMIELQRRTGMRPGEVCMMRTRDVDTSGSVWVCIGRNLTRPSITAASVKSSLARRRRLGRSPLTANARLESKRCKSGWSHPAMWRRIRELDQSGDTARRPLLRLVTRIA